MTKGRIHPVALICGLILWPLTSLADSHSHGAWDAGRPDSHAPIGVMGEHTHGEGEVMLSYRYMFMDMDGNRDGTNRVSTADVLADYMVSPTDMDMEMHMLGMMFAPRDWVTMMLMVPYVDISMNHVTRMGGRFKTKSDGLGDIRLTGLFSVYDEGSHHVHLNAGVSLPSGDIDARDDTPVASNVKLPYPMQLGSGTFDLLPGVTYLGQAERFSWGAQLGGTIRTGENDNEYTLGDRFDASGWSAYQLSEWFSGSVRLNWQSWGNIDGADPDLNPMMVPTADPDRRGGERLDLGLGLNFFVPEGNFRSFRLALEVLFPVHQDLDGPQLETDLTWILGAQMSF